MIDPARQGSIPYMSLGFAILLVIIVGLINFALFRHEIKDLYRALFKRDQTDME